jgi:mannose-6-phosphate isomerase-like protein (cupin superfamily)
VHNVAKIKTTILPDQPDAKSPAGADIRFIMDGETGTMIHSTVPPRQVNRATVHATVNEFWYVLEGRGEIWRDNQLCDDGTVAESA